MINASKGVLRIASWLKVGVHALTNKRVNAVMIKINGRITIRKNRLFPFFSLFFVFATLKVWKV